MLLKQERFNDALNCIYLGFNVDSLKKHFDPKYMQRFFAEQLLKEKAKRLSKERDQASGPKRFEAV